MRTPHNNFRCLRDAIDLGGTRPSGELIGTEHRIALGELLQGSAIASGAQDLAGRSVLIASADPFLAALALIDLDGLARRMVLCPPDLALEHLPYVMRYAEVDAVVSDGSFLSGASIGTVPHVICTPTLVPRVHASQERPSDLPQKGVRPLATASQFEHQAQWEGVRPRFESKPSLATDWILLTSGTTGRPKMVLHTLASLAGAIVGNSINGIKSPPANLLRLKGGGGAPRFEEAPEKDGVKYTGASEDGAPPPPDEVIWGTFYDIRRYGGLQIYLRAVLTRSSLLLTGPHEPVANFLLRAGEAGVTHISGTPSHWRRAPMSPEASRIDPRYIRLSGEIADQAILNSLHSFYPNAQISHAFATTEAGVAFDVRDALSGFPVSVLTGTSGVELKVVDATLRVRSSRTAQCYLGENPPVLKDAEDFVDTGDVLELREGRFHFQGRRDGVINVGGLKVHPEEVEAVLNRHPQVRLSLVKTKKNPITGALVVADVILKDPSTSEGDLSRELQQTIKQFCREWLAPHKVPAAISFVPALAISETGKLVRRHG